MRKPKPDYALEPSPIPKSATFLRQLSKRYYGLLNSGSVNEQVVQDFLEEHSELIPVPWMLNHGVHFGLVISKFALDTSLKSDFAYLTKSTAEWYLTLMELEHPSKPIFTANKKVPTFSAEFNAALGQIDSWKAFLEHHRDEVKTRLSSLLGHMRNNRLRFKFVLVYGRNSELESSQDRIDRFGQLNGHDLKVLTYDSLITGLRHRGGTRKNILTVARRAFKLKHLNCYPGSLFAYLSPHDIEVSDEQIAALEAQDFQMHKWQNGSLLSWNQRYPDAQSFHESDHFKNILKPRESSKNRRQ
jgi:hypothetical protein